MFWLATAILFAGLLLLVANHNTGEVAGIDADSFARLIQGAALMLVIGSALIFSYRGRAGVALRHATTWLVLAVLIVVAFAYRDELTDVAQRLRAELQPGYVVEQVTPGGRKEVVLRRRMDGHFVADVVVNGVSVTMLVDSGATAITLSDADARKVGLPVDRLSYSIPIQTANGRSEAAPVILDGLALGPIAFERMRALVARPGRLNQSLLGIGFLSRLESYEVRGSRMILRAP